MADDRAAARAPSGTHDVLWPESTRWETLLAVFADRVSRMAFDVELADPTHLLSLIASLKHLDGVFDAYRLLPGKRP